MGLLKLGALCLWLCHGHHLAICPLGWFGGPFLCFPSIGELSSQGLCLHLPWQGNHDSAWKEFFCCLLSLWLNPFPAGHEPPPAAHGGQGARQPAASSFLTAPCLFLLLLFLLLAAGAVWWREQVRRALGCVLGLGHRVQQHWGSRKGKLQLAPWQGTWRHARIPLCARPGTRRCLGGSGWGRRPWL